MDTDPNTKKPTLDKNQPEKYIRTFARDIKNVKEGGIPDLVPLVLPANPSSPASPMAPVPIQKPSDVKAQIATPPFTRMSPPVETLQTYGGDFSQKMKDTHSSMMTVLAAEQDSATSDPQVVLPSKSSPRDFLYGIAGSVLFIAAGVGAYFAYTIYLTKMPIIILAPVISAPIFVDDREQVSGTGTKLSHAISESVGRTIPVGAVRLLYIESSTTPPNSVFSALHVPAPDILLRNVNVTGSMAGIVNVGGRQSPFFILSVDTYSETFSGMLSWEPKMVQDLKELFPVHSMPIPITLVATSTMKIATSTISTPSIPDVQKEFLDEIVANHDVRIYRDADGQDVLLYGYWNQTTLVIARDMLAFTEILQRLANSRAH